MVMFRTKPSRVGGHLFNMGVLTVILALQGCANLESVSNFAKQSSSLTGSEEAIDYWATWGKRVKKFDPILDRIHQPGTPFPDRPAGPTSPPTPQEVAAIKSLQGVLSAYMFRLGELADDKAVDVSAQVDGLVTNLGSLPVRGATPTEIAEEKASNAAAYKAYGGILKLVKLPLEAYRNYKVKQIVTDNNSDIQALTKGLSIAMNSVSKFVDSEKNSVATWYDTQARQTPIGKNFDEAYLREENKAKLISGFSDKKKAIIAYKAALSTIGKAHQDMADNISAFNTDSFKLLVRELKEAKEEVVAAKKQYEDAFKTEE